MIDLITKKIHSVIQCQNQELTVIAGLIITVTKDKINLDHKERLIFRMTKIVMFLQSLKLMKTIVIFNRNQEITMKGEEQDNPQTKLTALTTLLTLIMMILKVEEDKDNKVEFRALTITMEIAVTVISIMTMEVN